MNAKALCEHVLAAGDVQVNGDRPWDIQVHDGRFYDRVLAQGSLGLGEAYMDAWWDCEALDEMMARALKAGGERAIGRNWVTAVHALKAKLLNLQTRRGARKVATQHYDIDDRLYMSFLDPYNQYTCAYFKDAGPDELERAQQAKMDLICRKIKLKPTDRVLDIGCGWGGLARWMSERHGCRVVGVTISERQVEYARNTINDPKVWILNMDYRDLPNMAEPGFDKVVSIGMVEHVGFKNHRTFYDVVRRVLKPDGLFLLQNCGQDVSRAGADPWIDRYIFPNGSIPSPVQLARAFEGLFVLEDWHNMGAHYDPTLMAWWRRFDGAWPRFRDQYGDRFYRMFRYYMLSCAGAFRARDMQLHQTVYSPCGVPGGYVPER
jgi:cyclopropane-fatty-acyl-phospholipid synthase